MENKYYRRVIFVLGGKMIGKREIFYWKGFLKFGNLNRNSWECMIYFLFLKK